MREGCLVGLLLCYGAVQNSVSGNHDSGCFEAGHILRCQQQDCGKKFWNDQRLYTKDPCPQNCTEIEPKSMNLEK